MKTFNFTHALGAALIGVPLIGSSTLARADAKDYEFQLVQKEMKKGDGAIVAVRLVDQADRQAGPRCRDLRQADRHGSGQHADHDRSA